MQDSHTLRAAPPLALDVPSEPRLRLFLVLVGLLPLHTVFLSAWVSWKPYLVLLVAIAAWDVATGLRGRRWPWHRKVSIALVVFLGAVLIGWPQAQYLERFLRLFLALVVGGLVMLVTERSLRAPGMVDRALAVVRWTGAAMAATAVALSLVMVGAVGSGTLDAINTIPGVFRVAKPAYLEEGFFALTNWHQDPGYAGAWMVLWAVLVLVDGARRQRPWWSDALIVGGLSFGVIMTFSRTGWLGLVVAMLVTGVVLARRRLLTPLAVLGRLGAAGTVALLLVAAVWAVDPVGVGGDLSVQFGFRLGQGVDLFGSLASLFGGGDFASAFSPAEQRADVWPEYLGLFRSHPWTGVGLSVGWQSTSIGQEPHNLVLELLAETGLVGVVAFAVLFGTVLALGGGTVGGLALTAALLFSVTQTVLFEPTWWFAAGLFLALGKNASPSKKVPWQRPAPL